MGVGVNGFRFGRRPEQLGRLEIALFLRLLGKCEVFAVCLGFPGKCLFETVGCF